MDLHSHARYLQARKYIADTLGEKYAEGVILDMEKMWEESHPRTPMVGLLSMGSDPTASIEAMAKKHKFGQWAKSVRRHDYRAPKFPFSRGIFLKIPI